MSFRTDIVNELSLPPTLPPITTPNFPPCLPLCLPYLFLPVSPLSLPSVPFPLSFSSPPQKAFANLTAEDHAALLKYHELNTPPELDSRLPSDADIGRDTEAYNDGPGGEDRNDGTDGRDGAEGNEPSAVVGEERWEKHSRVLAMLLASRRIPDSNLEASIQFLMRMMPSERPRMAENFSSISEYEKYAAIRGRSQSRLTHIQQAARLVIPVLTAQLRGEYRWCANCLKLVPYVDLPRCMMCRQVAYCE